MLTKGRRLVNLVKQNDAKGTGDSDTKPRATSKSRKPPTRTELSPILGENVCLPSANQSEAGQLNKTSVDDSNNSTTTEKKKILIKSSNVPMHLKIYNEANRILGQPVCLLPADQTELCEATVLVDESINSTTTEQSTILTHVIIPESPDFNNVSAEISSECVLENPSPQSADEVALPASQYMNTINHNFISQFDSNRSISIHDSSKCFTDLDTGSIINDSSHSPTLYRAVAAGPSTDYFDDSCSAFLDSLNESPEVSSTHIENVAQPLQSTSGQDAVEILRNDLLLSDESDISHYVHTESPLCPLDSPLASEDNNSVKENEDNNTPQRRRKGQPAKWQRNIMKQLRQSGLSYINRKCKSVTAKKLEPIDCSKCRYKCNNNFPENIRQDIFNEYWKLGDDRRQKMLISSLVKHTNVLRISTQAEKNRNMSRQYFLAHKSAGQHRVCQKFFCKTFNISTTIINTCSKQVGCTDFYVGQDGRIGKVPANKTPIECENHVKEHIDMYPRVESHYCRKNSKKRYLESDLNLSKLYDTYKNEYCKVQKIKPVSMFVYQKIFHSYEPQLSFFKPKKDQCTKCNVYKRTENKVPLQDEYDVHKRRERDSLNMKAEDKQKCISSNGSFRAITFDMQAILSVPFTGDSKIYYLRKLTLYNFTILDCYKNTGHCYMWDESNGKKGSVEIGTMLLKYLFALPETVNHVASFSDTCGGQNRNKFVTLAALYAVNNIPHLNTVDLKFMESGHSYLEADSMHSSIERARKHKSIFTLREYALVVQTARSRPKPYDTFISKYDEFYDLKALEKELNCNTTINTDKENVQWLKIKWLHLSKEHPCSIFYKYDLYDPDFMEINLCKVRSTKKKRDCIKVLQSPLKKAYESTIPVSQAKKKDLITLLKDGVIPPEYANYYNNIPCATQIIHVFTDSEESDDDD